MSQKQEVATALKKEYQRLNWLTLGLLLFTLIGNGALFVFVFYFLFELPVADWYLPLVISTIVFSMTTILVYALVDRYTERAVEQTETVFADELHELRAAHKRATQLQGMASVLRATLSFDRVVEEALDVCSVTLEESGVPRRSVMGAVFLFNGNRLMPVATRQFIGNDHEKAIPGQHGIVGRALAQAEPAITQKPGHDPELREYVTFQSSKTAVCIPLRAGFQIFGAMVLGSEAPIEFNEDHYKLFNAVADQAVIALQNAQLYQKLEQEKQRLIEADEEARKELARDLHDGPTQSIAAIAMRINFIRSLVTRDPQQALEELSKVEHLAKRTSKEIRGMLFTLRPLVLETQGLGPAIETVINKIKETNSLNIRLVGGDNGDILSKSAQSVVFSIVEEALGNARKYSEASLVEVRLWTEDNLFVARVQDNGVGFDTEDVNRDYSSRGSLGMVNMRERADRIDGSLKVESAPGEGTTVTLVVPLDKRSRKVARNNNRR